MAGALLYLGIVIAGYVVGIPLRKYKDKLKWVSIVQIVAVVCLVFSMGVRVGSNEQIVLNLHAYGLYAAILTILTMFGSVIAVQLARLMIGLDRYGLPKKAAEKDSFSGMEAGSRDGSASAEPVSESTDGKDQKKESREVRNPLLRDRMTLYILSSVCAGILSGFFYFRKAYGFEAVTAGSSLAITIGLCILLVFVGLDLGLEGKVVSNLRRIGWKVLILPLAVAVGTLTGALACTLFLPIPANESLAVGAGFGWYSLGAAIIMDAGFEVAGAISFMHNVMREICSVIFIPIVARRIGYVESVALPGSNGMDICLPIVEQATNGTVAIYSFITGFMVTMAVPFLVPFFLTL